MIPNVTEDADEKIPLPGGKAKAKVAADIRKMRAHAKRIQTAPETAEEREAQRLYLEAIAERGASGNVTLSARQKRISLAKRHLEEAKSILAMVPRKAENRKAEVERLKLSIANCHFVLGQFEEAIAACPRSAKDHLRQFREYHKADIRDDDALCMCSDTVGQAMIPVNPNPNRPSSEKEFPRTVFQTAHTVEGEFPNARRGDWVLAIRCVQCGWLNLRAELTESAAREELAKNTKGPDSVVMVDNGTCSSC